MQYKNYLIYGLIIIFGVSLYLYPTYIKNKPQIPQSTVNSYVNTTKNFSFEYPKDWEFYEYKADDKIVLSGYFNKGGVSVLNFIIKYDGNYSKPKGAESVKINGYDGYSYDTKDITYGFILNVNGKALNFAFQGDKNYSSEFIKKATF